MNNINRENSVEGAIYGLAYGDAYGWPNEFETFREISRSFSGFPYPAIITDDTQMSLYGLQALKEIFSEPKPGVSLLRQFEESPEVYESEVRKVFALAFLKWMHDPRNTRAPGINCLQTLKKLEQTPTKTTWLEGTSDYSKGCGANMRNPWFGMLPVSEEIIVDLSIIQSSVTHNNPIALASAALTALTVKAAYEDPKQELYEWSKTKVEELIRKGHRNSTYFEGLKELQEYLKNSETAYKELLTSADTEDICSFLGEGKVAEEALLLAIAAYDMYQEDVEGGLHRLANSGGDSDSIAAIGGAVFGAAYGIDAFKSSWKNTLELYYKTELENATAILQEIKK